MTTATLTAPSTVEPEQRLVLGAISWEQYEAVLRAFPEQAGLRITYIDGRLTFLSPSYRHDWVEVCLGHIVVAVANGCEIDWVGVGHPTYRVKGLGAGVEGDKAYYFGPNAERIIGEHDIDLTTQPPPDLAIEVEATHSADDSVATWGRLGVPEVWRFDVPRWSLTFGLRRDDGTYAPSPRSAALPLLEPDDVLGQLRQADQMIMSRWSRQLDGWFRDVLLPRRGE